MPKIIGTTIAEHREVTRARLFDALAHLMSARGFDAITLADIAAEAGVGRTAVYNHVADKEALLIAFIEHETGEYLELLSADLGTDASPLDRLRLHIRRQFDLKPNYHFAPGPVLTRVVSPETAERIHRHVEIVEEHLQGILTEAIAAGLIPDQDVRAASKLIHACVTGRPAPTREPERSRFIEATEDFLLRGLGV
ncbi:MAG: TetR/AcrR family transcriptional regulator [Actinomycetota bacterium]